MRASYDFSQDQPEMLARILFNTAPRSLRFQSYKIRCAHGAEQTQKPAAEGEKQISPYLSIVIAWLRLRF